MPQIRKLSGVASVLVLSCWSAHAQAQSDETPLYGRVALGSSYHRSAVWVIPASGPHREANVSGPAVAALAAIGVASGNGLNLAVELGLHRSLATNVSDERGGFESYEVSSFLAFTAMFLVDWYIDTTTHGTHVQGGLGLGGTSYGVESAGEDLAIEPLGWVAHAGIGYELGVTPELGWSFGLLARVDAGYYTMAKASPLPDLALPRSMFVAPGLYLTATYN